MIRLITFGAAIATHPQRRRSQMSRLITFGMAAVTQDRRAVETMIRLCPSGPAPVARTRCELWKVIRLAPFAPTPVDQTKCRQKRMAVWGCFLSPFLFFTQPYIYMKIIKSGKTHIYIISLLMSYTDF